jgi:translation initiation factor IF-2
MRVHILAKELNVPSKVIVEKCKAEGIDTVKNHMSTLSAGLHATIREWFSEGSHTTTVETAERVDLKKVRVKGRQPKAAPAPKQKVKPTAAEKPVPRPVARPTETEPAVAPEVEVEPPTPASKPETAEPATVAAEAPIERVEAPAGAPTEMPPPAEVAVAEAPVEEAPAEPAAEAAVAEVADAGAEAGAPEIESDAEPAEVEPEPEAKPIAPAGPQNVPTKAKLQGPRVVRYEAPELGVGRPRRGGDRSRSDWTGGDVAELRPTKPGSPRQDDRGPARRKGRGSPRRSGGRVADSGQRVAEWRDQDLAERRERLAGATGRRIRRRSQQAGPSGGPQAPAGPKTAATVHEPVRMKEFCSETGLNFMQCMKVLRTEHGITGNVNMTLPTETAELLAMHFGIELTVVPARTRLDELKEEFEKRPRKRLKPRPPVVTMLGHVDHGKTSLLDAIRKAHVVDAEDGGITQHIGAYHVKASYGAVTFLDTPGHEAFTAMRARGAHLTDVVVLVVAADDGIMPQTIEAINHAKAAEVPVVVALNKIDLGEENQVRIYGQLSEHGLTPSGEWGGETDVIATSAVTGRGVNDLIEHLAELSALLELRADPTLPAAGTVIEAETKAGVGAVARVLVREGTLSVGDAVVCGSAFGKVRALLDDRGQRIRSAGPALPVEVWGLDDVPAAGDGLYVVDNLQRAKDIAVETKRERVEQARLQTQKVRTLEDVVKRRDSGEVPELNVIVKADVDGSVMALRQALAEIPSDEVRLTFRHAGVGAVNDGDVLLAATCRGIIIAFRVETPATVRRLAEQHGVDVRPYRVIYEVCDDIKKALEGLLEPEERIEARGTAEVRELFRLGKRIGLVAGSYVTNGVVDRSHQAKVVRDGVVVREHCTFASLRRFKDDVKEVRAGLECGIRLEGFDDVHVGDIIETYEVTKIARTL